jgi:hypothetical protein
MSATNKDGRSAWTGLLMIVVGAWVVLAPMLGGGDDVAAWGHNPLAICGLLGAGGVLGGAVMLAGRPRWGGLLALGGGLVLIVGSTGALLWASQSIGAENSLQLVLWLAFFVQAGALIAFFSCYELGYLEPAKETLMRVLGGEHPSCETRRRRFNAEPPPVQRERLHGAATRHRRPARD